MKTGFKRILSGALAIGLALSLSTVALAEERVSEFSDVPSSHWAHTSIMAMTEKELFSGTTTPINGVGTFSPETTMTRAAFITVVVRALYQDELTAMPKSEGAWYQNAYDLALEMGLLDKADFATGALNMNTPLGDIHEGELAVASGSVNLELPMNRQEMAMVLVRAAEANGEVATRLISTNRIPDYEKVGGVYKDYVQKAYSMGMIMGEDDLGTYNPMGTLNRAQGAMVLYRLVAPETRGTVDFDKVVIPPVQAGKYLTLEQTAARENVTLDYNDSNRYEAKVGDKIIINGVTHNVVAHPSGAVDVHGMAVPYVKGVALDLGIETGYGKITSGFRNKVHSDEQYTVNKYTNEGYWASQWAALYNLSDEPTQAGTKDDQLSSDSLWVWDAFAGMWVMSAGDM